MLRHRQGNGSFSPSSLASHSSIPLATWYTNKQHEMHTNNDYNANASRSTSKKKLVLFRIWLCYAWRSGHTSAGIQRNKIYKLQHAASQKKKKKKTERRRKQRWPSALISLDHFTYAQNVSHQHECNAMKCNGPGHKRNKNNNNKKPATKLDLWWSINKNRYVTLIFTAGWFIVRIYANVIVITYNLYFFKRYSIAIMRMRNRKIMHVPVLCVWSWVASVLRGAEASGILIFMIGGSVAGVLCLM